MARRKTKADRIREHSKAVRGLERKAHFEAGGTVEQWRGRKQVTTDRRKQASKQACRGRVQE